MDLNLKGKVAIVTGGAMNIGRGIVFGFAQEGATVIIADILQEKAQQVAKEAKEKYSAQVHCILCDVTQEEQVRALIQETISRFGRLDILVNDAGIYPFKPFLEMTAKDWDEVMAVNMRGLFFCTREAARVMGPGSKIVNISSLASIRGDVPLCHYSASKGGVSAFTRSVALALADKKINVNGIAPGGVVPPERLMDIDEERAAFVKQFTDVIPWKRMGTAEDMANAVVFLASEKADYITGQIIVVDGGKTIRM